MSDTNRAKSEEPALHGRVAARGEGAIGIVLTGSVPARMDLDRALERLSDPVTGELRLRFA